MNSVEHRKVAVLYLRVSTEKQVNKEVNPEGLSIPSQRQACIRKAIEKGAVVHEREFVELAESAKVMDRPKRLARNVADQI